jgi:hypothetical protein
MRIVFHMGTHKTGTTLIQEVFEKWGGRSFILHFFSFKLGLLIISSLKR